MDDRKANEMMRQKGTAIRDIVTVATDDFALGHNRSARRGLLNALDLVTDSIRLTMRHETVIEDAECPRCHAEMLDLDTCPVCVFGGEV